MKTAVKAQKKKQNNTCTSADQKANLSAGAERKSKVAAESQKKSESKNKARSAGLGEKKRTKIEPPNCRKNKQMSKCRSKLKS